MGLSLELLHYITHQWDIAGEGIYHKLPLSKESIKEMNELMFAPYPKERIPSVTDVKDGKTILEVDGYAIEFVENKS
jgi:hypothetical protein